MPGLCRECHSLLDDYEIDICFACLRDELEDDDESSNVMGGDMGVDADDPTLFIVEDEDELPADLD